MGAIDQAKAHFSTFKTIECEVPEWGKKNDKGKFEPLIIYSGPVTLMDRAVCIEKAGGENLKFFAYLLIRMGKDKDGNKLFHPGDKADLMHKVDSNIVIRVGKEILRVDEQEDMEKK